MSDMSADFESDSGQFDVSDDLSFLANDELLDEGHDFHDKKIDAKRRLEQYFEEKALRDMLRDDF